MPLRYYVANEVKQNMALALVRPSASPRWVRVQNQTIAESFSEMS